MSRSQGPGAQWDYLHNFLGQRIRKTGSTYTPSGTAIVPNAYVGSTDILFYYDAAGHLIAEADAGSKKVLREYIWLGDMAVAIVAGATPTAVVDTGNAPALYYVHNDQIDTPRLVTDTSGNRRWSWDLMGAEPFGVTAANEAPAGQASSQQLTLNLRFPGSIWTRRRVPSITTSGLTTQVLDDICNPILSSSKVAPTRMPTWVDNLQGTQILWGSTPRLLFGPGWGKVSLSLVTYRPT